MGGNALSVPSCRLGTEEYFKLGNKILTAEPNLFKDSHKTIIRSYRDKETHGDIDFLHTCPTLTNEHIVVTLESNGFVVFEKPVRNGNVVSVGIVLSGGRIFQLDFIYTPEEQYDFAQNYFAYNDMGNLLGRVARRIGLKLGHDGLWYTQRAPENNSIIIKEHLLTNKWTTALFVLGYDTYDTQDYMNNGFNTLEDIFAYVMSSRYYDFDTFDLNLRTHKARVRDAKRPNYRAFLEYAQKNPKHNNLEPREYYLGNHRLMFPEFNKAGKAALTQHMEHLKVKKKYNGVVVSEVTGMSGKLLGLFMSTLKGKFTNEFVLAHSEKEIKEEIKKQFLEYKNIDD